MNTLKNVGKRVVALVLALMMCVGMLSTTVFAEDVPEVNEPETTGDEVTIEDVKAPLAVEPMAAKASCDHNWVLERCLVVNCQTAHNHIYKCTKCGKTETRLGQTHSHQMEYTNNPFELFHTAKCKVCGVEENFRTHKYNGATCTQPGVCVCGKVDPDGTLDPNNHTNTETVTVAATCLHEGSETVTCACGTQISSTTLEKDANNHDAACTVKNDYEFDADGHWTVRTCDAIGTKEAHQYHEGENECYVCGYKKTTEPPVEPTEPVDPTDKCEHGKNPAECLDCHMALGKHNYQSYNDTEATCTEDAVCKWDHCSFPGCNASYDQVFEGTKLGHSFTNYVPNNDATCMKDGTETATCDREGCGATDTRTVAGSKLEHDFFGELVPLNLQVHAVYCANGCGTHSEPVAHSFDITVGGHPNAVQATCQHMGIEVTQCKCGLEHYEVIEKLDHNYVNGECTMCHGKAGHTCEYTVPGDVIKDPTCNEEGMQFFSCEICHDAIIKSLAVDPDAHAYHQAVEVFPTCVDDGYETLICVHCGEIQENMPTGKPATGIHTPGEAVEENRVPARVGVAGSYDTVVYCDVCGNELSRENHTIPALPDTGTGDVVIDDTNPPLGGDPDSGEVELDDGEIPLAGPVTRAEFVDYLYRHEGSPDTALSTFVDVPADHDYANAVGWGQANNIAWGISETEFAPDELVTVEQVKLFLSRYAAFKGSEMPELAALVGLYDQDPAMNCDEILGEFFGADE